MSLWPLGPSSISPNLTFLAWLSTFSLFLSHAPTKLDDMPQEFAFQSSCFWLHYSTMEWSSSQFAKDGSGFSPERLTSQKTHQSWAPQSSWSPWCFLCLELMASLFAFLPGQILQNHVKYLLLTAYSILFHINFSPAMNLEQTCFIYTSLSVIYSASICGEAPQMLYSLLGTLPKRSTGETDNSALTIQRNKTLRSICANYIV